MNRLAFKIFFGVLFMAVIAGAEIDSDMEIFPQSAATVNDISAGIVNPAGLSSDDIIGFRYLHSYPDSTFKGDNGFLFGMQGIMVSVQWLKHSNNIFRRKYLLAGGSRLFPNFYWGLSYSRFGSGNQLYKGKNLWKGGFIYRPNPIVSLGLVVDDIFRPKFGDRHLERFYNPAIGFRPFGQRLTFSVDGFLRENESLTKIKSQFRIEALPKGGLTLVAAYRNDGFISLGLAYSIGQSQMAASGNMHKGDFRGGTIYYNQGPVVTSGAGTMSKSIGKITLDGSITEEVRGHSFFGQRQRSLLGVLQNIRKASQDKNITALYLDIQRCSLGFAAAQEIRAAIKEFKGTGKKAIAYLDEAGNLGYYMAAAADNIYLAPSGYLEFRGLSAEMIYLKGTMDKLGLQAEFIGIGQYKTAPEMFTRSTISSAESVQMNAMLDDFYGQFVSDIAKDRGFSEDGLKALIDEGPFSPEMALSKGLVMELAAEDEIEDNPDKYFGEKYPFHELSEEYNKTGVSNYWGDPAKIAIVYATGEITGQRSQDRPFWGRTMGEKTVADALRRVRKDPEIKAVVLRINSPGGEVMATDDIYRELEKIKSKKPLIISIGNVGASGGYYLACIGDEVFMMPGTVTGSIGIFTGKLVARGLYEKIGANKVVLNRGRHASIRSDWLPLSDDEVQLVSEQIREFYDDFVAKVARWRRLSIAHVDSIGQGRVWSGQEALKIGLGTNRGGIMEAIDLARDRALIRHGQPVKYEITPPYGFALGLNYGPFNNELASILSEKLTDAGLVGALRESAYYYRLPYNIEIK